MVCLYACTNKFDVLPGGSTIFSDCFQFLLLVVFDIFVQQILTDVPDYDERCHYLESLKNRLEALLSPHIVSAFSTQSLGKSEASCRLLVYYNDDYFYYTGIG